jgi:hypothetical protein
VPKVQVNRFVEIEENQSVIELSDCLASILIKAIVVLNQLCFNGQQKNVEIPYTYSVRFVRNPDIRWASR